MSVAQIAEFMQSKTYSPLMSMGSPTLLRSPCAFFKGRPGGVPMSRWCPAAVRVVSRLVFPGGVPVVFW